MNQIPTERLPPEVVASLEGMRARLMPLRYNIGDLHHKMMMNPGNPPSWPDIQKSIELLNSHIHSIINYINGYTSTRPVRRDIPPQAPLLHQLHVYPTPPFSFDGGMSGLVETLLRKKAGPKEDKWEEDRLGKAGEFCYVPADLGMEVKASAGVDEQVEGEEDEDVEGEFKPTKVVRRKGGLTEDDMMEIWSDASNQGAIAIHKFQNPDDEEEEGYEEGEEEEEGMEGVEMGDSGSLSVEGEKGGTATATKLVGPVPLPLHTMLKFMSTGATE